MRRIESIAPFQVMQMLEAAKCLEAKGRHIVHLEIGEPDFPTPASIIASAKQSLDQHPMQYTPSTGLPELQTAISAWYQREYDVEVDAKRILITPGTSGAFSLIYSVLLQAGDSVLLPDPGYPCQKNMVRLAGAEPKLLPVGPHTRYHLNADMLAQHWQPSTRVALVTNPGNPTGTLIEDKVLQSIARFCQQKGGYLVSDEIYHGLTYGRKARCALEFDDNSIVVNGFSKRWAMTGWRLGWAVVPESLIEPCRRVMQNIFISAPTLSQYAAVQALMVEDELEHMRLAYDERRQLLLAELPKIGFNIEVVPDGAFYIYAKVSNLTHDASVLCHDILEKVGVAITPGADFGNYHAKQYVRFAYATSLPELTEAVRRLKGYFA